MRKIIHILTVFCLGFGIFCTASKPSKSQTPAPADAKAEAKIDAGPAKPHIRRFLLIGDSHAINLRVELRFRIGMARQRFVEPLAAVGTRATGWIKSGKLKRSLKENDPDIILACFGTNEAKYNTSVSTLTEQFQSFVDVVSDHGRRRVIWISPPNLTGVKYLKNVRDALTLVKGIEVVDLSGNTYALNASEIHLTPAAYRMWGGDIWAWILTHSPMLAVNR